MISSTSLIGGHSRGRRPWSRFLRTVGAIALVIIVGGMEGAADEPLRVDGKAPPDHALLKHVRNGAFFVAKELKERYDELLTRVRGLQAAVAADQIGGAEALAQLRELEPRLDALRTEIEASKVLVAPVKVQTQTEEIAFNLGPERRLVVTADRVRVVGWDEPQVKCVLEKIVLGAGDEPENDEFNAMRVVHRHGLAVELVGKTAAEYAAEEEAFLPSDDGRALTDAQRIGRHELVNEIHDSWIPYRDFQGKELDVVEIEGLTPEQGNRQMTIGLRSDGGGGSLSSGWRRHAELTVYVPRCQGVLLRGCLAGLEVEELQAPLTVTDAGEHDRDYDGRFTIKGVDGTLTVYNIPLDRLEQVKGDVTIMATVEYSNSGTHHEGGLRTSYDGPPRECVVSEIAGGFTAWFTRVNLNLKGITGRIDVQNEAGNTTLAIAGPLADAAHRVVSVCGRIEIRVGAQSLGSLPVLAVTEKGSVQTNADAEFLDDADFTTGNTLDGSRRTWRGLKTKREFDPATFLDAFRRPAAVLAGQARSAGLDIISRYGTIVLMVEK